MASWGTKRGDLHSQDDLSPWVQWTVRVSNALAGCPYSKDCVTSENKHDWLVVSQKSGNISNCGGAGGQGVNLTSEYHSLNNGSPHHPHPARLSGTRHLSLKALTANPTSTNFGCFAHYRRFASQWSDSLKSILPLRSVRNTASQKRGTKCRL